MGFEGSLTVGVIGKTNAGKSTLVNALVGEKVSIVTPKKQTTRENILGILNLQDCQIVFVDTPGIHKTVDNMGRLMMKQVRSAKESVDLILYVVDCTKPFDNFEYENLLDMSQNGDVILVLSKVDIGGFEKVYPLIEKFKSLKNLVDIVPISAKNNKNLDILLGILKKKLVKTNEEDLFFDRDTYTDKSVRFMCGEIVREKILVNLDDEIPFGVLIEVTNFSESKNLVEVDVDVIAKRQSHKAIIIGKNGQMLKKISSQARADMEKLLDKKVMLKIYVATREQKG